MANDLNVCTMTGRLGADPDVRDAGSSRVANLRLAVGETWKDKQGERKEKTEWVSVTVWGDGLVGIVEKYLTKGSRILISGKFQTRKWQDKDGNDRYSSEVVLQGFDSKLLMLDSKSDGSGSRDSGGGGQRNGGSSGGSRQSSGFASDIDDDVPF
jgi:single-strand DNA-binding protein